MTRERDPKGKVLIIGGGIANFTDVAKTFTGIIQALTEYKQKLIDGKVRIWVRRGGPNYREGLAKMRALGEALGVPTTYFYNPGHPRAVRWVTRPDERRTLYYAGGITDVLVSPTMSGGFSMLDSFLEPGATSGTGHLDDSSEQGGYVLEGELTIWHGEDAEPVTLGPGDAFQLPPHAKFRYANRTDKPARVLWVFT